MAKKNLISLLNYRNHKIAALSLCITSTPHFGDKRISIFVSMLSIIRKTLRVSICNLCKTISIKSIVIIEFIKPYITCILTQLFIPPPPDYKTLKSLRLHKLWIVNLRTAKDKVMQSIIKIDRKCLCKVCKELNTYTNILSMDFC